MLFKCNSLDCDRQPTWLFRERLQGWRHTGFHGWEFWFLLSLHLCRAIDAPRGLESHLKVRGFITAQVTFLSGFCKHCLKVFSVNTPRCNFARRNFSRLVLPVPPLTPNERFCDLHSIRLFSSAQCVVTSWFLLTPPYPLVFKMSTQRLLTSTPLPYFLDTAATEILRAC